MDEFGSPQNYFMEFDALNLVFANTKDNVLLSVQIYFLVKIIDMPLCSAIVALRRFVPFVKVVHFCLKIKINDKLNCPFYSSLLLIIFFTSNSKFSTYHSNSLQKWENINVFK